MDKKIFMGLFLGIAVVGIWFGFIRKPEAPQAGHMMEASSMPSASGMMDSHDAVEHAKLAGSRVDLENKNNLLPGEVTLAFKLYGLDGHEFGSKDLKIAHEKLMHLILVRDDMTRYQHIHPEYVDGRWTIKTQIPDQGQYQMYVDIEPTEEKPAVLRVPLSIGGATQNAAFPVPTSDRSIMVDDIKTMLIADLPLRTKAETTLTFELTQSGQAVKNIEPYLGAFGHTVALRHNDPDDFFHAHPVTEQKPTDGKVTFALNFPVKGRYTLYAQFQIGEAVKAFPITVDVTEEGTASEKPAEHGESAAH